MTDENRENEFKERKKAVTENIRPSNKQTKKKKEKYEKTM